MTTPPTPVIQPYRVFVGGLQPNVAFKDIEERLRSFGTVRDVEITVRESRVDGSPQSFCHLTLDATEKSVKMCVRSLNLSKWRGGTLRVELASAPRFDERLRIEQTQPYVPTRVVNKICTPMLEPVDGERGWKKVKGRLMPSLTVAGPRAGAPPVRELPDHIVTRIKPLSEGPLAQREKVRVAELAWHLTEEDVTAYDRRRLESLQRNDLLVEQANAARKQRRNRSAKAAPVGAVAGAVADEQSEGAVAPGVEHVGATNDEDEDESSGSGSASANVIAIPIDLTDVDDASFEAVEEELSDDAKRKVLEAPVADESDDEAELAQVLKRPRTDGAGSVRFSDSVVSFDKPDETARVAARKPAPKAGAVAPVAAKSNDAHARPVEINVPRLRSLFFNVSADDETFSFADQLVVHPNASAAPVESAASVEAVATTDAGEDVDVDVDADDDNEYDARPVGAALEAGLFALLPPTSADSYLESLFGAPAVADALPAPTAPSVPAEATPQRVFRLLSNDNAAPEQPSAASVLRQAPPVAGVRSKTLAKQLQKTTQKERQRAEKAEKNKKVVAASKIATPMRMSDMSDIANLLAGGKKKTATKKN
jgi:hypothetical protein